jgi:hypothetical protein
MPARSGGDALRCSQLRRRDPDDADLWRGRRVRDEHHAMRGRQARLSRRWLCGRAGQGARRTVREGRRLPGGARVRCRWRGQRLLHAGVRRALSAMRRQRHGVCATTRRSCLRRQRRLRRRQLLSGGHSKVRRGLCERRDQSRQLRQLRSRLRRRAGVRRRQMLLQRRPYRVRGGRQRRLRRHVDQQNSLRWLQHALCRDLRGWPVQDRAATAATTTTADVPGWADDVRGRLQEPAQRRGQLRLLRQGLPEGPTLRRRCLPGATAATTTASDVPGWADDVRR